MEKEPGQLVAIQAIAICGVLGVGMLVKKKLSKHGTGGRNEMDSMFPNMDERIGCSNIRHFPDRKNGLPMVLGGAGACGLVVDVG